MKNEFKIAKKRIETPFLGDDGNVYYQVNDYRVVIKDENNKSVSKSYYDIIDLGNDHFAVCGIKECARCFNETEKIKENSGLIAPEFKWGVIRINRDSTENIIPKSETKIIPYLYDEIIKDDLNTAIARNKSKSTLLDLDVNSESYGKQLIPCVLDYIVPFSRKFEIFTECSIDGISGFIPRDCKYLNHIDRLDLLTYRQVIRINSYLKTGDDSLLDSNTVCTYFNLTGKNLLNEKVKTLKK